MLYGKNRAQPNQFYQKCTFMKALFTQFLLYLAEKLPNLNWVISNPNIMIKTICKGKIDAEQII